MFFFFEHIVYFIATIVELLSDKFVQIHTID